MYHFTMDRDELLALIANARWFAGYFVRSREIGPDRFTVKTNYPWIQTRERI
jgi:hypothetical protein